MSKKIRFIDCGANVGKATDWAKNKYKEDLVKVDAFEPEYFNYTELLEKYSAEDNSVPITIHTQAVWIENIIKDFYIQAWGSRTGSSLSASKEQAIKEGQCLPKHYRNVRLDLSDNRHFARDSSGGYQAKADCALSKGEYNILKVDIEGAEYKVIEHLLKTEAWEYIDEWFVEFTPEKKAPEDFNQEIIDRFKSTVTKYVDWSHF